VLIINNGHYSGLLFWWGLAGGELKLALHFDCAMEVRSSMLGLHWVDVEVAYFLGWRKKKSTLL